MNRIFTFVISLFSLMLIVLFQNCSNSGFESMLKSENGFGEKKTIFLTTDFKLSWKVQQIKGLDSEDLIIPEDNPVTKEAVDLGRILFFDKRLSRNGMVSCATCHAPSLGFSDGLPLANGIHDSESAAEAGGSKRDGDMGLILGKHTPSLFNLAFSTMLLVGKWWRNLKAKNIL